MRITMGLTLTILYLSVFLISYKRTKDVFSPLCFFSFMQFLGYVPAVIYFENHLNIELNETNVFWVFCIQILVMMCTWFGSKLFRTTPHKSKNRYKIFQGNSKSTLKRGIVIFCIGLISALYFIHQVGGIKFIASNTQLDYSAGNSYLLSLQLLMPIGIVSLFDSYKKPHNIMIIALFTIYSSIVLIFTRRAPVLEALMMVLFTMNYRVKRVRPLSVLKPKVIIITTIFILIIIIMPEFRSSSGFQYLNSKMVSKAISNTTRVFEEFSYTSRDAFVYSNYNYRNMYYGKTFVNILTAPLPSSVFTWKPPVDDGVYLANYVRGYYVTPPSNIYPYNSSYPFSSQGSMYANFGIIGVILGSVSIGYLYEYVYRILMNTGYKSSMIIIYQIVIYKFALTAKNITQSLIVIVLVLFIYSVSDGIKIKRVGYK